MLQTSVQNFADADALMAHYASLRAKFRAPAPRPAPLPAPVVGDLVATEAPDGRPPAPPELTVDEFNAQISCGKLLASYTNSMRLAKLIEQKHGLPVGSLPGLSQRAVVVRARKEWYWVLVRKWGWSLSKAGYSAGRDHTTVLSGVRSYETFLQKENYQDDRLTVPGTFSLMAGQSGS